MKPSSTMSVTSCFLRLSASATDKFLFLRLQQKRWDLQLPNVQLNAHQVSPDPTHSSVRPTFVFLSRDKESKLRFITSYKPQAEDQQFRILLHGPAGAGKSSFINSVNSVLQGRVSTVAPVNNPDQDGFTKKYTGYRIPVKDGDNFYPFVINDMMSLRTSSRRTRKVNVKDVKKAMKGHIRDGYTFNPECSLSKSDEHYNDSLGASDKVHILVCVMDASSERLRTEVVENIQDIREEATDLGIPQVAILTKIDVVCPKTKKEIKNMCRSKLIHDRVQEFSSQVGIPKNHIFPVKNYELEKNVNGDVDALILHALKRIIEIGNDSLKKD